MTIIRRLFLLGGLALIGSVAVKSWPDVARYLKIREM